MNWFKKKQKPPVNNWREESIRELREFRKKGETFDYIGIKMTVVGHYTLQYGAFGWQEYPSLRCHYVDNHGVLHDVEFTISEFRNIQRAQDMKARGE
jgi:hypothetical protein